MFLMFSDTPYIHLLHKLMYPEMLLLYLGMCFEHAEVINIEESPLSLR